MGMRAMVLPLPVAFQSFETVAWQGGKVSQGLRRLPAIELETSDPSNSRKRLDSFTRRKVGGPFVPIGRDHSVQPGRSYELRQA